MTAEELDQAILAYLERRGPSFMEDVWEAVGMPWPWPGPLLALQERGLIKYEPGPVAQWRRTL